MKFWPESTTSPTMMVLLLLLPMLGILQPQAIEKLVLTGMTRFETKLRYSVPEEGWKLGPSLSGVPHVNPPVNVAVRALLVLSAVVVPDPSSMGQQPAMFV